jgi:hypothetical protein
LIKPASSLPNNPRTFEGKAATYAGKSSRVERREKDEGKRDRERDR